MKLGEDPSFFERYRLVLKLILDDSVKEMTFIQRFCSETKQLFADMDKSQHGDLWIESGLKEECLSSKSIHCVSILRFLIPVIDSKIVSEDIKPALLSFPFQIMDREVSDAISALLDHVDIPSSYIENHFSVSHPVRIKFDALSLLKNAFAIDGDAHAVSVLRFILNQKPPSDMQNLRLIGSKIKSDSLSNECKVLKILFEGEENDLPTDMSLDSYFDCLKYFSRYLSDSRVEAKRHLLQRFVHLLDQTDKRVVLRVVDGLVRFGTPIDPQFVLYSLENLLKSYIDDSVSGLPSTRDPEESDLDSKLLSCTLEACREFYSTNQRGEAKSLIEKLLLSPKLEVCHRVSCLHILINLTSASDSQEEMSSEFWFRHTTCRHWEIQETFLLLISHRISMKQTKGIPSLKGFLALQLKHESSFVRSASLRVLQSIAELEGISGLCNTIDATNVESFFRTIFESEPEAIVRRQAAKLLSSLEMDEEVKKVSISALKSDLDWEVKEILLNMWGNLLEDPLAKEVLDIAKNDHEKRLQQKAFKYLKLIGMTHEKENCFDEYVDVMYGLPGLMNDILMTRNESYKVYDADCF